MTVAKTSRPSIEFTVVNNLTCALRELFVRKITTILLKFANTGMGKLLTTKNHISAA